MHLIKTLILVLWGVLLWPLSSHHDGLQYCWRWRRRSEPMNPFALVWCYNADADERDERQMRRWRLWWYRRFGNSFAKCWREI